MIKWAWILAAAGILAAAPASGPSAGELDALDALGRDSTQFFVRIPLGRGSARDLVPSYGLAIRGRRDYELFVVDSRMLSQAEALGAGIEVKFLIVGGVAAVAAVAATRQDSSASQKREDQVQQQQQQQKACPNTPPTC